MHRITSGNTSPDARGARRVATDERPTVYIVDDDISVRESLEALIELQGWAPRTFSSAEEFLAFPARSGPACLILDVGLPDLNGLDLQAAVAPNRADMPIIFITGVGNVPMSVKAMKAGAVEFLTKPFGDDVLLEAVAGALDRSHTVVEEQASTKQLRDRFEELSRREREVMRLVVAGLLNKQVGGELGISEITVKAHRGRVMKKLGARSLAELVKMSERLPPSTMD